MRISGDSSERVLILAPHGRDAEIASVLLAEAGRDTHTCADVSELCAELKKGAAFAVITVEAVSESNLADLSAWVASQPAWSDMPIVLLTTKEDSPARVGDAARYQEVFGNVTYLERPFHPTTLVSVARSAIRSRLRQYEARASLERYMLLARELQHRTKNLLAIIQSIAAATLPAEPAREAFFARLHALAKAQDLLMERNGGGVSIKQLVQHALEHFGGRISTEGPDVYLNASAGQGFALILHELATNATKYGSLRKQSGKVIVRWSQSPGSPEELFFTWCERGGPPVSPPKRKGFGTMLLEVAVPTTDALPRFEYAAEGFKYELRTNLDSVSSAARAA